MAEDVAWRPCSSCKKGLPFEEIYWVCNVSTCNRKRTGLIFCSVSCWDAHLPLMRHREAWAEERRAPSRAEWQREQTASAQSAPSARAPSKTPNPVPRAAAPARPPLRKASQAGGASNPIPDDLPKDILIVASKLKKYIKARSGMNTSDSVMGALSDRVRRLCDAAIRESELAERKTVMDRDFK